MHELKLARIYHAVCANFIALRMPFKELDLGYTTLSKTVYPLLFYEQFP